VEEEEQQESPTTIETDNIYLSTHFSRFAHACTQTRKNHSIILLTQPHMNTSHGMDSPSPPSPPPTAISPQMTTPPSTPGTTTTNTATDAVSETDNTQNNANAAGPILKTTTVVQTSINSHIQKKRLSQKQTALTNFYKLCPLHVIETNPRAHKSRKLDNKLLSSKLRSISTSAPSTMASPLHLTWQNAKPQSA
jgi:hypothetical protein